MAYTSIRCLPYMINIDDVPLNRFHIKMAGLTFGAHFTDGYILGQTGLALTFINQQIPLSSFWQGLIGSSVLIGLFIGSFLLGWLSERIGRQKIFCFSFLIIIICTLLQLFVHSAMVLFFLRVMLGIGLGGDYSVGHTLLAEISPKKYRGILLGSFNIIWNIGYVAASFLGYYLLLHYHSSWQFFLATACFPAVIIFCLRLGTPESPRWLMNKGKVEEARCVIKKYLGDNIALPKENYGSHVSHRQVFNLMFSRRYRRLTVFNSLFFVCLVMPYFAIYTFLPMILGSMQLGNMFNINLLINVVLIIGALLGLQLTVLLSRRTFLLSSFVILAILLFVLSLINVEHSFFVIGLLALFTLLLSAVSNLVGVFPAESFPTPIRALGVGFATSISRLGSAVSTLFLPVLLAHVGVSLTFFLLAIVLVIGFVVSYLWAPETKSTNLNGLNEKH